MLQVEDHGQGPPVVWLHGFGLSVRMWDPVIDQLKDRFRCLALNARGHGSPWDGEPLSHRLMTDDVVALLDGLGLGRVALVGSSFGAHTGADVAVRAPERVTSLVLESFTSTRDTAIAAALVRTADELDAAPDREAALDALARLPTLKGLDDGLLVLADSLTTASGHSLATTLREVALQRPGLEDVVCGLAGHRIPTLLVVGELDASAGADAAVLARSLPAVSVAVIAGTTHPTACRDPVAFTRVVSDFLREPSA